MGLDRPLRLLRFALETHDLSLAQALARALGPGVDGELRSMPRLGAVTERDRPLLRAALEAVASG